MFQNVPNTRAEPLFRIRLFKQDYANPDLRVNFELKITQLLNLRKIYFFPAFELTKRKLKLTFNSENHF